MDDPNCQMYGIVNFGHGPVEVRCTRIGKHRFHKAEVEWVEEPETTVVHKNLFEG